MSGNGSLFLKISVPCSTLRTLLLLSHTAVTHTRHHRMPSIVALQSYGDDDYLIFDCPGQIELYSHATVFRTFVDWMRGQGWSMCAVYCLDCQFVSETPKFIAGSLQALAAMVQLELPHVNVLTKVDLVADKVCMYYRSKTGFRLFICDMLSIQPEHAVQLLRVSVQ